jgi:hypothetical protein
MTISTTAAGANLIYAGRSTALAQTPTGLLALTGTWTWGTGATNSITMDAAACASAA